MNRRTPSPFTPVIFVIGVVASAPLAMAALMAADVRSVRASALTELSRLPASRSRTVLKLGHVLPADHPVHKAMRFMARRASELSSGAVDLQVYGGGELGNGPDLLEQTRRGTLAGMKTTSATLEEIAPDMAVFGLPYLFRSDDHYWNTLLGDIGKEVLATVESHGLHAVCYYDGGARSFYTLRKPILAPGDIQGLKLRVMESRTSEEMIATLGGSPAPIPYAEVFPALQRETIDGAENNPPSFYTSGHYQTAKHYSLDEHTRIPDILMFNKKTWEDLPPRARRWIEQAAAESVSFELKLWREQTEDALKQIEKAGVLIYHPDKTAFAAAMAPMYTKLDGTRLGDLAKRIMVAD